MNKSLFEITHGLYILTSVQDGKFNGQCLDALMQVSSRPPRIAISVGKSSLTHEMIVNSKVFVVNVLDRDDPKVMEKVKHFGMQSGRKVDKFSEMSFDLGEVGAPIILGSKAFFECKVLSEFTIDLGTHTIFVGSVERTGVVDGGEPFTYNEYRKIKFGKGD